MTRFLQICGLVVAFCLALVGQAQAQTPDYRSPAEILGPALAGPYQQGLQPPHSLCYAPGTSAAQIQAIENRQRFDPPSSLLVSPFRAVTRWTQTVTNGGGLQQGDPTTLTYSFVPDGTAIPRDGQEASNLQQFLTNIYGSPTAWRALFAQATAAWSKSTGITYVYEPNDDGATFPDSPGVKGVRGDVRIGGHNIDGDGPGILAYNFFPDVGDMVIDTSQVSFYTNTSNNSLGLRNVVTHEMGHGLGLAHVCPIDQTKLMEPFVSSNFDGPQFDDVTAIQQLYGDKLEPNDSATKATDLGTASNQALTRDTVSIDGTSDTDFYQFATTGTDSLKATITLAPDGPTYLEGPQNADSTCTAGATFDPKSVNDLGMELLASNGQGGFTSVATANAQPVGGTETFDGTFLPGAGPYLVRVFGGTTNSAQRYKLSIAVGPATGPAPTPTPQPPAPADGPVVDLNGTGNDTQTPNGGRNTRGVDYTGSFRTGDPPTPVAPLTELYTRNASKIRSDGSFVVNSVVIKLTNIPDNCPDCTPPILDNEVLGIDPELLKNTGVTSKYETLEYNPSRDTQRRTFYGQLTLSGQQSSYLYEYLLHNVTYFNKLGRPNLQDRIVTFKIDDGSQTNEPFLATATIKILEPQSLVVTTAADSSGQDFQTSLREAMDFANQSGGGTVTFSDRVRGTINLVSPLPDLTTTTTIQGPGARLLTVRRGGGGNFSIFRVTQKGDVTLQGLTIANGQTPDTRGPTSYGGGIDLQGGQLTVTECNISGNNGASGGGIANRNGTLNVVSSLIAGNTATVNGGGIYSETGNASVDPTRGSTLISNSTLSGNTAAAGGGLYNDFGRTQLTSCTVTANTASTSNAGGGIASVGFVAANNAENNVRTIVGGTIVSGNSATDVDTVSSGTETGTPVVSFSSGGYNIVGRGNSVQNFNQPGDQRNINDASLGRLANNGGLTDTHALNADSVAINAGDPAFDPTADGALQFDQRGEGFPRVFGSAIDIGAYEAQNTNPTVDPTITPNPPRTNDTITVTPNGKTGSGRVLSYTYEFSVNGNLRQRSNSPKFDLSRNGNGNRGDTISVVVTANDGAGGVGTGTTSVVIVNSAPDFSVAIAPAAPKTNDVLIANLTAQTPNPQSPTNKTFDADGDNMTYTYVWKVNGVVRPNESNARYDLSKVGNGDVNDVVSVEVTSNDGFGGVTTRTDSVTVFNTPPVANSVSFRARAGELTSVLLSGSDADGDAPSFRIVNNAKKGTSEIRRDTSGRYILFYQAISSASGADEVKFVAVDRFGRTSDVATASITVDAKVVVTNRPPQAVSSTLDTRREVDVTKILLASDPDGDPLTYQRVGGPSKGTGEIKRDTDGKWKLFYRGSGAFTGSDLVKFVAIDDKNRSSNVATITINFINSPPTAFDGGLRLLAGTSDSVVLLGKDVDSDTLSFKRVGGPSKGTAEIKKDANGVWKLFYTNSAAFTGDDEVRFVAVDTSGATSNVAKITIIVQGQPNRPPVAQNGTLSATGGVETSVVLQATDPDGDPVTYKRVGGPTNGTGAIRKDTDGVWKLFYTARFGYIGSDEVRFVAFDDKGRSGNVAAISITVQAPPAAVKSGSATSGSAGSS